MPETMNKCPGCGRHCDLSAPSCPRGEVFARGETPEAKNGEHNHGGRHGEHGENRRKEHGHEHGERRRHDDEEQHGHEHREKRPRLEREEYEALDLDGKLSVRLSQLQHMSRFAMDSRGGQGKILNILAREESMTQRALTEELGIQPGSASEVIGKLERAGLIERSENAEDRRTADVRLTELGRAQAESSPKEKPPLFSSLSEEEKETLLTLLEKLGDDWQSRFHAEGRHRRKSREEH